jgi:triosephosphate isomerase
MNRKLIAGNWKMNLNLKDSEKLAKTLAENLSSVKDPKADVLICPTYVSLAACSKIIRDSIIMLGAQNVCVSDDGAYTGEISATMLKAIDCEYVIIGHSERRKYYGETNETVNSKILKSLEHGLKPIMCVGETLQEREDEIFEAIVGEQVVMCLTNIPEERISDLVIAYEPVWAIGTGVNATPKQASHMHQYIRKIISEIYSASVAANLRILYGGSVNPKNASEILSAKGIDGALVGGASLKADDFMTIISSC